jgi:hypothetical protein
VQVDLHMLRPLVLDGVGGEVDHTDIVAVDQCAPRGQSVQLSEKLSEPGGLSYAISDSMVFRLGTGPGDHRLALRRPGHQVAAKEDSVARGRAASVRTPRPVSVSVDDKVGG